jgi:predicted ATPase
MHLSLLEECRGRAEQALAALGVGANRTAPLEMKLQAAFAASLMYTRGAVPEIAVAWTKALEIAESLDNAEYQLRSLWGLWSLHISGGRFRVALALAQRFGVLTASRPDETDRLIGERMLGVSQHYLGDHASARRHIERMLAGYVPSVQKSHIIRFQTDQRMTARAFLARILWLQGFPDQAMREAQTSVEDAPAANHAISLGYALALAACPVALLVGNLAVAEYYVGMLLEHSTRHALPLWHAWGRSHQGVLVIKRGDVAAGLRLLRTGFEELGEANSALRFITLLGEMAEALVRTGRVAEGLAAITEGIDRFERTEENWIIAELLRIKGEVLLLQGAPEAAALAEDHFRQALEWAGRQGALSWELRATTSLARLLRDQSRSHEANALLEPVYGRFTEGFDTADLQAAKALLLTLQA